MDQTHEVFGRVAGRMDYPMFIVTAAGPQERAGCLVGFVSQCSVDPMRYMVFLSNKNLTHKVALEAEHLGVHLIPRDRADLAAKFGGRTGDRTDKFASCRWSENLGTPLLDDCPDRFVGRILERTVVGDHTGFLVEPVHADESEDRAPLLTFQQVKDLTPGHEA